MTPLLPEEGSNTIGAVTPFLGQQFVGVRDTFVEGFLRHLPAKPGLRDSQQVPIVQLTLDGKLETLASIQQDNWAALSLGPADVERIHTQHNSRAPTCCQVRPKKPGLRSNSVRHSGDKRGKNPPPDVHRGHRRGWQPPGLGVALTRRLSATQAR